MFAASLQLLHRTLDSSGSCSAEVDVEDRETAQKLISCCEDFLGEIQHCTPGQALEQKLNAQYGPGTRHYDNMRHYLKLGLREGWTAAVELDGPSYRRSKICLPSMRSHYFSITAIWSDKVHEYRGNYHAHPYGEIACIFPVDKTAQVLGPTGYVGAGWSCPGPGTHHYPQFRGGRVVVLYFVPAGRIWYGADPNLPQADHI